MDRESWYAAVMGWQRVGHNWATEQLNWRMYRVPKNMSCVNKLADINLMRRVDSLEKTLILGGIGGRRRRGLSDWTVLGLFCCMNFSQVLESRGYLLSSCSVWASHCRVSFFCGAWALGRTGFSSSMGVSIRGSRAREHRLNGCDAGFSCSTHVGSSWIRDWTHVSYIGRQILYRWATREAPDISFLSNLKLRKLQFSIFRHFFSLPAL